MKKAVTAFATVLTLSGVMAANASADTYDVKQGDTLWGISQKYETSINDIKEMNQLSSNMIYPSQKIVVSPNTNSSDSVYIVKAGDTLSDIADQYGVTVDQLKDWNNLQSDVIFPKNKITVNTSSGEAGAVHKAQQVQPTQTKVTVNKPTVEVKSASTQASSETPTQSSSNTSSDQGGKQITVTATAYTADCAGCSGVSATGMNLKNSPNAKVIAVDPNVIPLGSKVYVEGYGTAIAADTGGAIKGNRIDVLVPNNSDAQNWGRKTVTVKVLD
ncbi:LysM peptidoglycan-binding and 3D domain-containing protein [Heyndrickxia ginsengihumi]|uniref:LysM peptidoglycan-binding domain-containing protein n=1 Tax=Heyndrickxia ginsengihumi TaxID=363870 RepID=A0A6M0P536_9BACI|nr:3D domain-containing protein [Heyndrickxia ginsengihumi]MBE6184687.1 LysM peptidoglycan-binding domain-containing protein [Bacillus sp. (in: firmicutes)]MCM3023648.1 LysM peptidoglycan-binding domain-containing protein [Heyndrickxia ginsengihumi]NEY19814.1 LysM peptidoglycan-binding domain-containing protein [Heyndrickxia ginsengihumi]